MTARERVRHAYARIAEVDRPEVWITLRPEADCLADADAIDARVTSGHVLPLAGRTLAVKDNIDVAGLPTTAGCPAFAHTPDSNAPSVARLIAAGVVVLGKTNLDQFATGLVGTRSPYGAVRDARRPELISGGSSSGSAVAAALGIADLALGTDTAGSGRVPAAFQGLVGIKPTRGLVPSVGVVPACRTLDCVTVFALELGDAADAFWCMQGDDPNDPLSRSWPPTARLAAPPDPRVAVPRGALPGLSPEAQAAFTAASARLGASGALLVEVDIESYLAAGRMLYDGAFVAERHAAVGAFVDANRDAVDSTVGTIISSAGSLTASALATDQYRIAELAAAVRDEVFAHADVLLLPTTTTQPSIAGVMADPLATNSRLGIYTSGANLLDLCAVAVPAGEADGGCFGVSLLAPAFGEHVILDVAARLAPHPRRVPKNGVKLFVVGAHRRGQPLNHQLVELGGRFLETTFTSPDYRLHALPTEPPKPGLARVAHGQGVAIEGELWTLPEAGLGSFLAEIPRPMTLGRVVLLGELEVVGFQCEYAALEGTPDISHYKSWPSYLAARE